MPTSDLAEALLDKLDKYGYSRRPAKYALGLRWYEVNLAQLRLSFSRRTPFVEIPKSMLESESPQTVFQRVRDLLYAENLDTKMTILLFEAHSKEHIRLIERSHFRGKVAVLGENELVAVRESSSIADALLKVLREQIPLVLLSPYEVTAPVTGSQFFGRETEIRSIVNHPNTSFWIIGSRRLGKTSLLKEILERIAQAEASSNDPNPEIPRRYLYVNCLRFNSIAQFYTHIMLEIDPRQYNRLERTDISSYFPDFLRKMHKRFHGRLVLFMDEVDQLLKIDRQAGYEITRSLIAAETSGQCRLIWAGFREAKAELERFDSPTNAKFTHIKLGPLSSDDTRDLIQVPMTNMGVTMQSRNDLLKRIERDTGGHPNFVQHICQALVRQMDASHTREITPTSLVRLADDEALRSRVISVFTSNTNDFEKMVAYSVADLPRFTIEQVDECLQRNQIPCQIGELEEAMSLLEYLGVIEQRALSYQFTSALLPKMLLERYGADFVRNKARDFRDR